MTCNHSSKSTETLLRQALSKATLGNRNDTGLWLACQLRDDGYSKSEAETVMVEFARHVSGNAPEPYTVQEAIVTLSSAFSRPKRSKGTGGYRPRGGGCQPVNGTPESVQKGVDTPADTSPDTSKGLTVAALAEAKKLQIDTLKSYGITDFKLGSTPVVRIPYCAEDGSESAVRFRLALEGARRFRWRRGDKAQPYGLDRLPSIRKAGWVLLVEGESDCWICWYHGIPAIGAPGKSVWKPEWKEYLAGVQVYVWQEPEAQDFTLRVLSIAPDLRCIVAPAGIKDVSEAHIQGLDVSTWLEQLKRAAEDLATNQLSDEFPAEHELAHAETLSRVFAGRLRWASHRGAWRLFSGHAWESATEQEIAALAAPTLREEYIRQISAKVDKETVKRTTKLINETCTYGKIQGALNFLRGWFGVHTKAADWDADAWCLNVANGMLDLRDMTLRSHSARELCEKNAPVEYVSGATAPSWEAHIERFLPNAAIRRQLQRDLGRALIGTTVEECISFWYGTGANGKTTTSRVLQHLLGNYVCKAAPNLLVKDKYLRHSTEVADLCGSRLVFSVETDADRQLNEAFVKDLTGGDTKKARFMGQDFFEFEQTFDVVLVTNHKPAITGSDDGIWRRVRLIPWEYRIPEQEKLPQEQVIAELIAERSGILNWLLAGLADWKADPHWIAPEVLAATQEYRLEQDVLAEYLQDRCEFGGRCVVGVGELYDDYTEWCVTADEMPQTKKQFGSLLRQRGLTQVRGTHGGPRRWRGLRIVRVTQGDSTSMPLYENIVSLPDMESSSPIVTQPTSERQGQEHCAEDAPSQTPEGQATGGPPRRCSSCGSTQFWQRRDGGWLCQACHPQPLGVSRV